MAAKTDPINTSNPAGNSNPKQGDDFIRTLAKAVLELLTVDHYIGVANPWGSESSGDETGEHAKVTFHEAISDPSVDTGKGILYIKGDPPELYFRDEDDGNVIQLTSGGEILFGSLSSIANDTYLTAANAAGDGTVDLIKATTGDIPEIKTGAVLSTSGDPTTAAGVTCKEYVEGIVASAKKDYIKIIDSKASGNDGQSLTSGDWRKRELTNEVSDTGSDASIASSQITLAAGTYECRIWCPVYDVNEFISRLYNVTDAAVEILGTCGNGVANITSPGWIMGRFTIADTKVFQIQTYPGDSATTGNDAGISGVNNIYTVAEFWKIN